MRISRNKAKPKGSVMKTRTLSKVAILFAVVLLFCGATTLAYAAPGVNQRSINIYSDGTRLSADIFSPKDATEGEKLPAIVLCHGWGGVRSHLNRTYAPKFAAAGFVVLAFDYRGWGDSDSRLVIIGDAPKPNKDNVATVKVRMIRELVDPFDQLEDIQAAINFIEGEPGVDTERIGIWGTSFGGGLVIWTAAHDTRVKAVVAQVGAMDGRAGVAAIDGELARQHQKEIQRARGEIAPVPQGEDVVPGLRGTPYISRFIKYVPVDHADKINVPVLFIDAENEELFNRHEHAEKVYNLIKDRVPSRYHVEPGIKHYGIYQQRYKQGSDLALAWFKEHLSK